MVDEMWLNMIESMNGRMDGINGSSKIQCCIYYKCDTCLHITSIKYYFYYNLLRYCYGDINKNTCKNYITNIFFSFTKEKKDFI